jgi:general stress protein 26
MHRAELLRFLRQYKLAVVATSAADGAAQAAVVGFAVSDRLEIVFDTLESTRKHLNLRKDPRAALVIGWDDARTAQIQGVADFPQGEELERMKNVYFEVYPDGRERLAWPGITHVRVRPDWVRFSDYTKDPAQIVELLAAELE